MSSIFKQYGTNMIPTKQMDYTLTENSAAEYKESVFAFMVILYTNMFLTQQIQETHDFLKGNDYYYGRVKTAYENLLSASKGYDREMNKVIISRWGKKSILKFTDMLISSEETVRPRYDALHYAITDVFKREYRINNADELSSIYAIQSLCAVANEVMALFLHVRPSITKIASERKLSLQTIIDRINILCDEANTRITENVCIDLNKQLTIGSKKRSLRSTFLDRKTFAKAFVDSGLGDYKNKR